MPRFSIYSDPKKVSQFIKRFWSAITLMEERQEVINFFQDLLTPTEIRMLAKRLQIADMLAKGYKYQDIQNYVRVTKQTVASINNKLNFGNDGFIRILKKLEKVEKQKQYKLEGKTNLFSQNPGLGRAASNIVDTGISRVIRHLKKVESVKKIE